VFLEFGPHEYKTTLMFYIYMPSADLDRYIFYVSINSKVRNVHQNYCMWENNKPSTKKATNAVNQNSKIQSGIV
jgi:hypothetical protein